MEMKIPLICFVMVMIASGRTNGQPSSPNFDIRRALREMVKTNDARGFNPGTENIYSIKQNEQDLIFDENRHSFRMNHHGRPLSTHGKYLGRPKREILKSNSGQGFNPGHETVNSIIQNEQDLIAENQNSYRINHHGRHPSSPGKYLERPKREIVNPGNENVDSIIQKEQHLIADENQNSYRMNHHGRPLSNPGKYLERPKKEIAKSNSGQGFNPENEDADSIIQKAQDLIVDENRNSYRMNHHGRPLSNPGKNLGRPKREIAKNNSGQRFNPGNENNDSIIQNEQDLIMVENQNSYRMNHHGRPLSTPGKYIGRPKGDIVKSSSGQGFNPGNKNVDSIIQKEQDLIADENWSSYRMNHHGRPLSTPGKYLGRKTKKRNNEKQ